MCRHRSMPFAADPRAAGAARTLVVDSLTAWQLPELVDTAELLTSELVTNALLHARTPLAVSLAVAHGWLEVSVADRDPHPPRGRHQAPVDAMGVAPELLPGGRGLLLVDALADEWGVEQRSTGKQVWFTLATGPRWPYLGGCRCRAEREQAVRLASGHPVVALPEPWVADDPSP